MADVLANVTTLFDFGWKFISSNEVLFSACCVGLAGGVVHIVKGFF